MEYVYDIEQFKWDSKSKSFHACGWHLNAMLPDGSVMSAAHPHEFPSGKSRFIIKNFKTSGFRRFTFSFELKEYYDLWADENEYEQFEDKIWVFESEDGIKCYINTYIKIK